MLTSSEPRSGKMSSAVVLLIKRPAGKSAGICTAPGEHGIYTLFDPSY